MGPWPSAAALRSGLTALCYFFRVAIELSRCIFSIRDTLGYPFSRRVLFELLGLVGANYQRRIMSVALIDLTEIHRLRDCYMQLTF